MQFSGAQARLLAVVLACVSLFAASVRAQNIFGSIVGTVSDPTGAVLPGSSITVTNLSTGEKRTASTDSQGNYRILSLPRGEYSVNVEAHGFKHFSRSPIDVVVDQIARVDVSMAVGEQNQIVTVNAAPPIMQTDSSSLGQAIEG
ncbi:MAG TPA: carboxypeptidase-like regulatory domain-containing protein, partial [Terriglobales bacterium]|nr:carboxypeptidase-like regulatory domain-containing protein [Terriglobales bacterium]